MEMKFERVVNVEVLQSHRWKATVEDVPQVVMSEPDYEIVHVTPKDTEKVLEHLRRCFFREEPLNHCIKLLGENGDEDCYELEQYCSQSIPEGLSLMAVSACGTIVGVVVNGSKEPGHQEEMERDANACPHPRFRKIVQLLAAVDRDSDVFGKFPDVDKLVEVRVLSVDSAMRGRGIAKALLEKSAELAKQHGYTLMRIDCSSHYSALAAARLGYECVFKMQYEDYRQNGEPVFHPEAPHKDFTTYVRRLRS